MHFAFDTGPRFRNRQTDITLFVRCLPVHKPLHTLVSWFEEEVRGEAGEEERDVGVQFLVDLFGLDAPFQCQRRPAEQGFLELQKGRFNSQQLFQSSAACGGVRWMSRV